MASKKTRATRVVAADSRARKEQWDKWAECRVCVEQMTGGPRCWTHNPEPIDTRPYIIPASERGNRRAQ